METIRFTEAEPFIEFIERNKQSILGHTLVQYCSDWWPVNRKWITDEIIILEMDDYCLAFSYLIPSDIEITIGTKKELESDKNYVEMLHIKQHLRSFFEDDPYYNETKHLIEGCKVVGVEVERFSKEFECNCYTGETRPDGGDYFNVIRLFLDSGTTLCFDGYGEGYTEFWCENDSSGERKPSFIPFKDGDSYTPEVEHRKSTIK